MSKNGLICFGHRGAKGYEPENTLVSFQRAISIGVPWIEFDVWAIGGEVFVFHDHRLERVTNGTGYLPECTPEYLRSLDAGSGQHIPSLKEVLEVALPHVGVNIEIKGPQSADLVIKTIEPFFESGQLTYESLLVSSFNHQELIRIKELDPRIRIGALVCGIPQNYAQCATDLGAYSINQAIDYALPEFIADAKRRNLKVYVYTANHPDDIKRLISLGVDGIFSDYPDRVLQALSS